MLPFCGYNMGDYFGHWLKVGADDPRANLPRLFYVNWFRKDDDGRFVWPGFGENSRVLKWIVERLSGDAEAVETPIGNLPAPGALDLDGLRLSQADLDLLLTADPQDWKLEADRMPEFFADVRRAPARAAMGAAPGPGRPARLELSFSLLFVCVAVPRGIPRGTLRFTSPLLKPVILV